MWQFTAIVVGKGGWLVDVTTRALSAWLREVCSPWVTEQQARAELQQSGQRSSCRGAWPRAAALLCG